MSFFRRARPGRAGACAPSPQPEDELAAHLAACAAGDAAAFREIYRQTSPRFLAILTDMLKDQEAARDVLQQAYLSIWRHAGRFDPAKGRAFTWMLVITRNCALDLVRTRAWSAVTVEADTALAGEFAEDAATGEQLAARRLLSAQLSDLPARTSQAIVLNVVHGFTCREISAELGVPPNTVKSWIRRGLARMREDMPGASVSAIL